MDPCYYGRSMRARIVRLLQGCNAAAAETIHVQNPLRYYIAGSLKFRAYICICKLLGTYFLFFFST